MMEDSTMTSEQILNEQQARQNNFHQAVSVANRIIDNNPIVLAYYWYMWTLRGRQYVPPYQSEQMTRRRVQRMPLPTEDERSLLQQHLRRFSVMIRNDQIYVSGSKASATTQTFNNDPTINFSKDIFDMTDDHDRWLFVASNILHELVHCFEPDTTSLEDTEVLFCVVINSRHLTSAPMTTFEQGEVFEMMMFGGIIGRIDNNAIYGCCSKVDPDFQFVINNHDRYRHFFHSYDLTILYNIIQTKKRRMLVFDFLRSVVRCIVNFVRLRRT